MSQIKAEKFTKNLTEFNVETAVLEVIDVQEYNANQKRVKLEASFVGFSADMVVKTDKKRLQQVLINL